MTRHGMLTIIGEPQSSPEGVRVRVRCDCGEERVMFRRVVLSGNARSCGRHRAAELAKVPRPPRAPKADAGPPLVRPLVPVQSIFVPDARLLGRAVVALADGPLTLPRLARACGVTEAELVERQAVLRGHVHALRFGDDVAYLHSHGLTASWEQLEPMRAADVAHDERKAA